MAKSPASLKPHPAGAASGLDSRPIVAGIVTALVGFTSSFAVVLAGLKALGTVPLFVGPVIICWLLLMRFAPRWAVPGALLVALGVIVIALAANGTALPHTTLLPTLAWTTPSFSMQAMVGIALPLFVVTMASQNVPGVAVLRSFGYGTPWRPAMLVTGAGTALGASFGGHAINLAALSAALAAGEEAGHDRSRR